MICQAIIERDRQTGFYVGSVPGISGAHTQAETIDGLMTNLAEVLQLLKEQGALVQESDFVGVVAVEVS